MVKKNLLREKLNNGEATVCTRIWSSWPTIMEACASTGSYDYIEFVAEYAPFDQYTLENLARTCEYAGVSSMIKVDWQNRFYVAQKAMAAGFQSILFTDHKTAKDVEESLYAVRPDNIEYGGRYGYPNTRWIGYQPYQNQRDHAAMVNDTVKVFMIEKYEAVENIEEICSVPGVDMVQFGPSDYSMSRGWNVNEHRDEVRAAEEKMIRVALEHGVQARCEIDTLEQAQYYASLGVRHFCIGDEFRHQMHFWRNVGGACKEFAKNL